jgi:pimeloyl-ACP methyl ester carboxylesterase
MTNSQFGNVSGFDPEKPTVLVLHPMFFDTQWLDYHWGDPRLYQNFNLIAFDMRCSGRTVCRPNPRHDTWVEAADVALCHLVCRVLTLLSCS